MSTHTATGSTSGPLDPLDGVQNLLYRRPELYDAAYADDAVPAICARLFARHLAAAPCSLLDVGCGTGREVAYFAGQGLGCVGVDYQEQMVGYARGKYPALDFRVGDMRDLHLDRTFDVIVSFGIAIAYMHTNDDVTRTVETFARHAAPGTLLILEFLSTLGDVDGGNLPHRFTVDAPELQAEATSEFSLDRRHQLLVRDRTWQLHDGRTETDFVRFRLIGPMELEHHLAAHGFETVGMYDADLDDAGLRGPRLLAVARFEGPT